MGVGVSFFCGYWVHIEHNIAWVEAYLHTKWHLDASSRLATIKMAENWGLCTLFGGEELCPHLAQCGLDQGLYLHVKYHLDPSSRLATIDMAENWGLHPRAPPPFWEGGGGWVPI